MKKLTLLIFLILIGTLFGYDYNYRHYAPITDHLHITGGGNCHGYALARFGGKKEFDIYCNPLSANDSQIQSGLTTDYSKLSPGDVIVWDGVLNKNQTKAPLEELGHSAYVTDVPDPFVLANVQIRQVFGSSPPSNGTVGGVTGYGSVAGFLDNNEGYSYRVTLANLFDGVEVMTLPQS